MGTWDRVRALLRRERRDVEEALDAFETRASASLDQRERELHATPEEKMAIEQERMAENDAAFDDVRRRIENDGPSA